MKFYSIFALGFLATFANAQQSNDAQPRMKGDYLDVPVKAGYRIAGNDDDGFLEDGIIVAEKGTGYIDQKYRKRYEQTFDYNVRPSAYQAATPYSQHQQARQPSYYQPSQQAAYNYQPQASSFYDSYYYPQAVASNQVFSRYAVPEIIYGRRDW